MTTERMDVAASRRAAAALRLTQVRERLTRLQAGEPSTVQDVQRARASAAQQHAEAVRAQQRLRQTCREAAGLHRRWSTAPPDTGWSPAGPVEPGREDLGGPGPAGDVETENRVLRRALVAIASDDDVVGGWSKDHRQELWESLSVRCADPSWRGWSDALCLEAVRRLPGVRGAAVSSFDPEGVPHLLAVSDDWTRRAEEVAELVGEGPATEAYRSHLPVLVRDLDERQPRWPAYAPTALGLGLRSLYALPVTLDRVVIGALTLYPTAQDGRGWTGWTGGLYLAAVATRTLLADLDAVEQGWPCGGFTDDRVQMATGMLAVRLDVGVAEAALRLRAYAFSNALGLGEVAQAVVDGSLPDL